MKMKYIISATDHPHMPGTVYYTGDLWTYEKKKAHRFSNKSVARNKVICLLGLVNAKLEEVRV